MRDDLTLQENEISNMCVVHAFQEMIGGKGPDDEEKKILQMLEQCDSDSNESSDSDSFDLNDSAEGKESHDQKDLHYRWYEELKVQLKEGKLKLDKAKEKDRKLCLLLETESLQPYEIIRLRNVYAFWEQSNSWEGFSEPFQPSKEEKKASKSQVNTKESKPKRSFHEGTVDPEVEATPNKRKKLLEVFDLKTPSPLLKRSEISETEMKQLSVSVHLWAERKMGGVDVLQKLRLNDSHFKDILQFTGPESKWNLMKNRTLPQLRRLWRNSLGGRQYYRGHMETGFETEFKVHSPSEQFCPFGHCASGIMSPMDLDLIRLTPKKTSQLESEEQRKLSSRKLFVEHEEGTDVAEDGEAFVQPKGIFQTEPMELLTSQTCARGIDEEDGQNTSQTETYLENASHEGNANLEETSSYKENSCLKETSSLEEDAGDEENASLEANGSIEEIGRIEENERTLENSSQEEEAILGERSTAEEPNFVCKICAKNFLTFSGFERHNVDKHNAKEKVLSICPICEKKVIYLDQHMRGKHSKLQKSTVCEICLQEVKFNMQKHRKNCIKCLYCDYENSKKARLINHIRKCPKNTGHPVLQYQYEPLDLRSPLKQAKKDEEKKTMNDKSECKKTSIIAIAEPTIDAVVSDDTITIGFGSKKSVKKRVEQIMDAKNRVLDENDELEKARKRYPFDAGNNDEDYYSEIEMDDTELFTVERRKNKDDLELRLRGVDGLQNADIEGDNILLEKFTEFMRNKYKKESKEGYSKQTEPSTIILYSDVVRKDILKAFHKLVSPFDARWLTDCKTPKICKFEGEERLHVEPKKPFYMTSRILQEALQNTQSQKKRVIAAFNQLMEFIELHFTLKMNAFGPEVLSKVMTYHNSVKTFIKGTSQWKNSKDEERESHDKKKLLRNYQNPNKDMEILEEYKKYIKSSDRSLKIHKLLSYASPDAEPPTAAIMTELGTTVMEEIVACTGCRPKVVRHLKMGAYIDARPGFNPHDISGEDATLEEEVDGEEIWRRVDPNLPPKEKACIHQQEAKSAICSENCVDQCIPEGHNFWITWDKTQSTKGPYFLHIPTPIKGIMDRYDIVRSNYFKDKKPKFAIDDTWLEDEETPFFLNSACNSFQSLDLRKLSGIFGMDITAYSFRRIVCTWALNHKSGEIRDAEEEALQHSLQVAKDRYMQNKQTTPQNLVQTYSKEENLFPATFRRQIQNDSKSGLDTIIAERQEKRAKVRHSKLIKQDDISKKIKFENRPLGPRTCILESDRREIVQICEEITGSSVENLLTTLKPVQWRNLIVRQVCSTTGETGEKLRELWLSLYKGDLLYGIRDVRFKAKEENWPLRKQNPGRKDRNSWIAHGLRKSCLAAQKFIDMEK